ASPIRTKLAVDPGRFFSPVWRDHDDALPMWAAGPVTSNAGVQIKWAGRAVPGDDKDTNSTWASSAPGRFRT
ncbi:MAG TPA: hypothetical protein VFS23_04755, partial [Vicinamibacterales bacterium]|nr:hypothetical protein [Vicinamibacterales bacterium]